MCLQITKKAHCILFTLFLPVPFWNIVLYIFFIRTLCFLLFLLLKLHYMSFDPTLTMRVPFLIFFHRYSIVAFGLVLLSVIILLTKVCSFR